jgi:hypothetical protein
MLCFILVGCTGVDPNTGTLQPNSTVTETATQPPTAIEAFTPSPEPSPTLQDGPQAQIPNFDHIVLMVLENRDYADVIGSSHMPHLNALAKQNVLLSNYFAVRHPSLPNYIALVSGSTQNISSDCTDCFVDQPNLADLIEAGGRTWKAYLEDMPSPCFVGDEGSYAQKHNPLIYFDSVRLNAARCQNSIVPMTQLDSDLAANTLPSFSFIMPNMCNSAHDCSLETADNWVNDMVAKLQASPAFGENTLIAITFDEGDKKNTGSCCGLGNEAGGQVATMLISPMAKRGFEDGTPYSHYSLLKTILVAWGLPDLGQTQQAETQAIIAPWMGQQSQPAGTDPPPSDAPTPTISPSTTGVESIFPIRAAFYYPWFPESWDQSGLNPYSHYQPTLGYYSEDDPTVIAQHIAAMQYGKIQAGIVSWWGQGHYTDKRVPALIKAGEETGFQWSIYIETEGYGDPSVDSIRSDLEYIRNQYASSSSYLKIDNRFVVFVYADRDDGCSMASRWAQANTVGAYLVLKVFSGYRTCPDQPDTWHQYAPDLAQKQVGSQSFTISPGFWKADDADPRLVRDVERWNADVRAMVATPSKFHLITTFNEWGEGSSIESASGWESPSGYGLYLDALHYDGIMPSASSPSQYSFSGATSEKNDSKLIGVSVNGASEQNVVSITPWLPSTILLTTVFAGMQNQ